MWPAGPPPPLAPLQASRSQWRAYLQRPGQAGVELGDHRHDGVLRHRGAGDEALDQAPRNGEVCVGPGGRQGEGQGAAAAGGRRLDRREAVGQAGGDAAARTVRAARGNGDEAEQLRSAEALAAGGVLEALQVLGDGGLCVLGRRC